MKISTRAAIAVLLTLSGLTAVVSASAATGQATAVMKGAAYGFDADTAIASNGTTVWVANSAGNSVAELSATNHSRLNLFKNSKFGFDGPNRLSDDGTDLWVANSAGNSV